MLGRTLSLALLLLIALLGGFVWFASSLPTAAERPRERTDAIVVLTGGDARVAEGLRLLAAGQAEKLLVSGVNRRLFVAGLTALLTNAPPALAERVEQGYATGGTLGNGAERGLAVLREARLTNLRAVLLDLSMPGMSGLEALPLIKALAPDVPPELAERVVLGYAAGDTLGNAAETAAWMREQGFTSLRLVTAAYHMPRSLLELQRALPGVTILAHPVFPPGVRQEGWWEDGASASRLLGERVKYLAALISGPFRQGP